MTIPIITCFKESAVAKPKIFNKPTPPSTMINIAVRKPITPIVMAATIT